MVTWWMGRLGYEYTEFNRLMNTLYQSEFGIVLFVASLILLYLIPLIIPDKIVVLRSVVTKILTRKKIFYAVFITGSVVSSAVVFNFILGKSSFVLTYPLPMFFNGICMILLALIGLYYFLEIDRIHILAWITALALLLVVSMSNIVPFYDPLRFMEFLYIPLAIIAAFGVTTIAGHVQLSEILPIVLALFVIISVATSFPSLVFLGNSFEPGHSLFDTRNWVIQHPASEISAISWLDNFHARGVIETDAYVGYAARGIIRTDAITIQTEYSFAKEGGYPQSSDPDAKQHYLLILSRFTNYLEFGGQWLKEKAPLTRAALTKIDRDCNVLYDNGNAVIFSFSTP
jgi:hypothetical protein